MDSSTEFELPSPKRIRLEGPEHETALSPAMPVDDIDDLYGTQAVRPYSPTKSPHIPAPAFGTLAPPIGQKLFSLPGLGMLDADPASTPQTPIQQSQAPSYLDAEQSCSAEIVKNVELEDGQQFRVNGGLDSGVDDERGVSVCATEPEKNLPVPSETLVNENTTAVLKSEERVLEAEAPNGLDSEVDDERGIRSQTTEPENTFSNSSEILVNGNATTNPRSEERILEEDAAPSELDPAVKPVADIQTTTLENSFPVPSEILVTSNHTTIAKSENRVLNAEVPVAQDGIPPGSEPAQVLLNWHSSGTVIDNEIWLGGYVIENLPTIAPDSITAKAVTSAEGLKDKDVDQICDGVQGHLFSEEGFVDGQGEKTISTELTFAKMGEANQDSEDPEFELDSSPLGSESSSDDSSDTSSSDDSDADDYEMLSPAEQARRLMAEDGGSDDEGKSKGCKVIAEIPRTLNEKPDEFVPKPTVVVTEDMKIEELGLIENTVENLALIKANTSGEYQVLESGSLLCLQDRTVIGIISEPLGRVQQPYYSVRFTNATAIAEAGVHQGTKIYYVTQHSTTVFTQPLKAYKGSDASNLHDEEVGDDELEFSDDEAEAEHKRQVKQQRMAKRTARDGQPDGFSRGPQQRPSRPDPHFDGGLHPVQEHPPNSTEAALNYDDADGMEISKNDDESGLYTPLTRPSNLHEILSGAAPPMISYRGRGNTNRGRGDSRGGNRGRGYNRGRGGRMRGSERGGQHNREDHGNRSGQGQSHGHPTPRTPLTNGFSPPQSSGLPPRPSPDTIGYQQSTNQGNGFPHPPPHQSPNPPPVYQTAQQSHFHSHPSYQFQHSNTYNQPYLQQPPPQPYPSNLPQRNHSQYYQSQQPMPQQGYSQQFAPQPGMSFPPRPQYPPSLPPGAHINPNFFKQQGQPPSPQNWQPGYNQQHHQHPASPAGAYTGPSAPASNETRLQDLLRGLGKDGD